MLHVPGGEELALLDVDCGAGLAGGDQEVGLAAEEGGDLQDIDCLGGWAAVFAFVNVGQDGDAVFLANVSEDLQASDHADAAWGGAAGAVGLVVARLEDQGDVQAGRDLDEGGGALVGMLSTLDLARARDENKRQVIADGDLADDDVGHPDFGPVRRR